MRHQGARQGSHYEIRKNERSQARERDTFQAQRASKYHQSRLCVSRKGLKLNKGSSI
jgi:hypothetical protein